MKKLLLLVSLFCMTMAPALAFSPTASTDVYDLSMFNEKMLDIFYDALQKGRAYPTDAEFEAAGVNLMDIAFVRSHVRPHAILLDHSKDINQNVTPGRKLWMNVPIGIGKFNGGYPNNNFGDDTFTGWNYTAVFGSWNHGLFHAPGVVTDAGHKHGTDVYSGIKFFDTTGNPGGVGAGDWMNVLKTKDANGYAGYKYVEPLINCLMYFGQDGINYNWEDSGFTDSNIVGFHQACYKLAKEKGFDNFHIGIYTSYSQLTAGNCAGLFGSNGVKTADAFLNYSASDFASGTSIMQSVRTAEQQMGTADGVYQGAWIVSLARSWSNLVANNDAKKIGIVLWGEHAESRLHSYCTGNDAISYHENYQKLQDRVFSGGNRNPANRPAANNRTSYDDLTPFQGLAEYIPERTAIDQNLPFTTFFNTGAGERYNYKGKKTAGSWYNLGTQDIVPTYRWLVYQKGTTTPLTTGVPELTGADAYIGGNCLRLLGTEAQDIVLYRAKLAVSGANPKATIALKSITGPTKGTVSVIVKKLGSNTWEETAFANVKGNTWEEQTLALQGIAQGDVIEYVGLRTSGDVNGLFVGELSLNDDSKAEPAAIKDLVVDVKEESKVSMSFKLRWAVDAEAKTRAANALLYNDEANIDHFEILYKNGEDGLVSEVGRTSSWSTYLGNKPMAEGENPYIGVRAVSVDGKTYSNVLWVNVPRSEDVPETSPTAGQYPSITINPSSDGLEKAYASRWLKKVVAGVGKLDISDVASMEVIHSVTACPEDKSNYALAENTFKCKQGDDVTFIWTEGGATDGLKYCTARGYADWDRDCNFNAGNDELVWKFGEDKCEANILNESYSSPYTLTFHIPEDAAVGETRLRLVYSDAWFPHPGPTGITNKGFAIDFPLEISGTNPSRQPAVDIHDQGVADQPIGFGGEVDAIQTVQKAGASKAVAEEGLIRFENTDKAWVISAEGKLMKFAKDGVESISTQGYAPGTYFIRMQCGPVVRTQKVVIR